MNANWDKAVEFAKSNGEENNFAYISAVYKNMLLEKSFLASDLEFLKAKNKKDYGAKHKEMVQVQTKTGVKQRLQQVGTDKVKDKGKDKGKTAEKGKNKGTEETQNRPERGSDAKGKDSNKGGKQAELESVLENENAHPNDKLSATSELHTTQKVQEILEQMGGDMNNKETAELITEEIAQHIDSLPAEEIATKVKDRLKNNTPMTENNIKEIVSATVEAAISKIKDLFIRPESVPVQTAEEVGAISKVAGKGLEAKYKEHKSEKFSKDKFSVSNSDKNKKDTAVKPEKDEPKKPKKKIKKSLDFTILKNKKGKLNYSNVIPFIESHNSFFEKAILDEVDFLKFHSLDNSLVHQKRLFKSMRNFIAEELYKSKIDDTKPFPDLTTGDVKKSIHFVLSDD